MNAREQGEAVIGQLRQGAIEGFDLVAAVAVALGVLIAEQSYPDEPQLSIICCGAIIGASARDRRGELLARGNAVGRA